MPVASPTVPKKSEIISPDTTKSITPSLLFVQVSCFVEIQSTKDFEFSEESKRFQVSFLLIPPSPFMADVNLFILVSG